MRRNAIYLLLGGNVPDRIYWIEQGRTAIAASCGTIVQSSNIYETAAWGKEDQAAFLNVAFEIETELQPLQLLAAINKIETTLGRQREVKWGSRTLDIDILFYGDQIIDLPTLNIPHPHLPARRFALQPLCDIAPDLIHPQLQKTIAELLALCPDPLPVKIYQQPA